MKAHAVSYGAVELKRVAHTYLLAGLAISVAIHLAVLVTYFLHGLMNLGTSGPTDVGGIVRIHWDNTGVKIAGIQLPLPQGPGHANIHARNAMPVPVPSTVDNTDSTIQDQSTMAQGVEPVGEIGTGNGELRPVEIAEAEPPPFVPVQKEPVVIKRAEPVYPALAIKAGIEGKVWVKIWVDKAGKPHKAEVMRGDVEMLNEAALAAAMQFEFIPAYMNEGPVAVWVSVPFTFRLAK